MKRLRRSMTCTPFLLCSVVACAAALADGAKTHASLNLDTCRGCHGIPGYRTAYPKVYSVPKLGGQQSAYIVKALKDYRSGSRSSPIMRAVAASLSDSEIAAIAAYYSGPDH